jgi:uncharacterized protein YbjT (DUF2867 family)
VTGGRLIAITGSQGGAAAKHLRAAGWRVRGLTRKASGAAATRLASSGVEMVEGNMSDARALDRLVQGAHGVYGVTDLYWIAVDDVRQIAARAFGDPARFTGQAITSAGDGKSIREAREIFRRVRGKAPLAIPAPLWLIRLVVNADLVPMWEWLGKNPIVADLGPAREILPEIKGMEPWLRGRSR